MVWPLHSHPGALSPAVLQDVHGAAVATLRSSCCSPGSDFFGLFAGDVFHAVDHTAFKLNHRRTTVRHRTVTVDRIEIINITGRVAAHDADQLGLPTPDLAWGGDDAA